MRRRDLAHDGHEGECRVVCGGLCWCWFCGSGCDDDDNNDDENNDGDDYDDDDDDQENKAYGSCADNNADGASQLRHINRCTF